MEHNELAIVLKATATAAEYRATAAEHYRAGQRVATERVPAAGEPFRLARVLAQLAPLREEMGRAAHGEPHDAARVERFGADLFDELFKGAMRHGLDKALVHAAAMGRRLRLRLDCPGELRALPWELMFRSDQSPREFVLLNGTLTLVRGPAKLMAVTALQLPLRILVVACSPRDRAPVHSRLELELLLESWAGLIRAGVLLPEFIHGPDAFPRMLQVLERQPVHILHFIGHGEERSGKMHVLLEDEAGRASPKGASELWRAFQGVEPPRMAVLNLCRGAAAAGVPYFSSLAEVFLAAGIPAVLAHQFDVSHKAAAAFARSLYAGLLEGMPVDEAMAGVRQLLAGGNEWAAPVLFLHSPNGELFLAAVGAQPSRPAPQAVFERARQALAACRWAEAASLARLALILDGGYPEAPALFGRALAEEKLDTCLQAAAFAALSLDWAATAAWCTAYRDNAASADRPASERERMEVLRCGALAGLGARDPSAPLREPCPYDLLARHGIHPGVPAKALRTVLPLEGDEHAAWRLLRDLARRLELDFFLYQVSDHTRLAEFLGRVLSSGDAGSRQRWQRLLGDDLAVVLLLLGKREEARALLEGACGGGLAGARARHRLALMFHAEAQRHEERGEREQADSAWRRAIAYSASVLADDPYWEHYCAGRQGFYGPASVDTLGSAQRAAARERLGERIAAGSRSLRLELLQHIEWQGCRALQAVGGLPVNGETLAGGPLLVKLLGLERQVSELAARQDDGGAAGQALRCLFSELAPAAALLEMGRPGPALQALPDSGGFDAGFEERNPGYAALPDRLRRFLQDAAALAARIYLAIGQEAVQASPVRPEAARAAWLQALALAGEAEAGAAAARSVSELVLRRAESLRPSAETQNPEEFEPAIAVLEAAHAVLPGEPGEEVVAALAEQLSRRGVCYEMNDQHDEAEANLRRASELHPGNVSILIDLCSTLIFWAIDLGGRGQSEPARRKLEAACHLAEAGLRCRPDRALERTLVRAREELEILDGAEVGLRAFQELDRLLDGDAGRHREPTQQALEAAQRKRERGDYGGAIGELQPLAGSPWARAEIAQLYAMWAAGELEEGSLARAGEIVARAEAAGYAAPELVRLRRRIQIAGQILELREEEC